MNTSQVENNVLYCYKHNCLYENSCNKCKIDYYKQIKNNISESYNKLDLQDRKDYENAWILNEFESRIYGLFCHAIQHRKKDILQMVAGYLLENKNFFSKRKMQIFYDKYKQFENIIEIPLLL